MHYSEVKKYCKNCNSIVFLRNNRDVLKKKFCSRNCNAQYYAKQRIKSDPTFLERFIKAGQTVEVNKKKGIHPNYIPTYKIHNCLICNKEFNVQLARHNKGYGKCCSKKCYYQYYKVDDIKTQCIICGIDIWDKPKKNRRYCSCSCRAIDSISKQKFKNTDIELKLKKFLEQENVSFQFQPLIKDIVNADFLVYPNIVIFADGDYWHSLPHAIKRDIEVDKKLLENNYKILRFKGSEINKNFEVVKTKIKEICHAAHQSKTT